MTTTDKTRLIPAYILVGTTNWDRGWSRRPHPKGPVIHAVRIPSPKNGAGTSLAMCGARIKEIRFGVSFRDHANTTRTCPSCARAALDAAST